MTSLSKKPERTMEHYKPGMYLPFQATRLPAWRAWLPAWMFEKPRRLPLPAPITLVIIAIALAAALSAPYLARNITVLQALGAAAAGLAGFVILQRWPILGFLALIPTALIVPFSIGTGSNTGINAAVLMVGLMIGLWVLDMLSRERRIHFLPYPAIIAAFVFCITSVVAFGFGQFYWLPAESAPLRAQIGGLAIFVLSAGVMVLTAHRLKSVRELEWIVWVFLAFGGLYVIVRTMPGMAYYYQRIFVRQAAQGAVFYIWLAALGTAQVLLNTKLDQRWRAVIAVMLVGLAYQNMIVSRDWVSGWLPPLIAVGVVLLIARPKAGILLGLAGGLAVILLSSSLEDVLLGGGNTYSYITRVEAWRVLWELIKLSPVFGLGMANYYWYTPLFSILGWKVSFNSHNNYIDLVAQTGVVGLVSFLWMFWELWRASWRLHLRLPDGFEKAYTVGALGGLVGTLACGLLGDWVIPFVYNIGLSGFRASLFAFLFMGGVLAIQRFTDEAEGKKTA